VNQNQHPAEELMQFVLFILVLFTHPVFAESSKTEVRLDTITVSADSSFDSLSEESYVPTKKINFEQNRSGTLDSIMKNEVFPSANYGYPSGATGVNLSGRTIDDTQVFTLGVPLNLPQGGGADFSFFPAYLWSSAIISPTLSPAGFSPQAASGSIQLKPWTREAVRDFNPNSPGSRATIAYDRNLQTYSLATRLENMAVLAGMSTGLQKGPAAEFSYYLLRTSHNHLLLHFIGSSQEGNSFGSRTNPTPNTIKKTWRVIPVVESHQRLGAEFAIESTLYADLQELLYQDPAFPSDTRTQQYGLENAILYRNYTLALSGRYINYVSNPQSNHEWPILGSLTGEYALSSQGTLKLTAGGDYLNTAGGFYALGRATYKYQMDANQFWFAEASTTPKLPTLVARFYPNDGFFVGNPNLQPECVNAILLGHDFSDGRFGNTLTLKGEYRSNVQINQNGTVQNAGNAYLTSLKDDVKWKALPFMEWNASTLLTYSQLKNTNDPYPSLPYFSQLLGVKLIRGDLGDLNLLGRYIGKSRAATFAGPSTNHPDYFLMDTWLNYHLTQDVILTAGIDNVFDTHPEVVYNYPLPGRVAYLSAQARF
jgi:hypothetical protein